MQNQTGFQIKRGKTKTYQRGTVSQIFDLKGKSTSFSKCFSKVQLSISNLVIFSFFKKCLKSTLFQI